MSAVPGYMNGSMPMRWSWRESVTTYSAIKSRGLRCYSGDSSLGHVESSLTQENSAGILSCQTLLRGDGLIRTLSPNSTATSYISIISCMVMRTYRWFRTSSTNEVRNELWGFFLPASKLKPFCDLGWRFQRSIDPVQQHRLQLLYLLLAIIINTARAKSICAKYN